MRIQILEKFFFFLFSLIMLALVYMQVIRGEHYHAQSVHNRIRVVPVHAPRGRILDRNDVVLADNQPSFNVAVISQDIEDEPSLFKFLGGVLRKDPTALQREFTRGRVSPFEPVIIAEAVERNVLIAIAENRFLYPGILIQESFERVYPMRAVGAHAIGYVGKMDEFQAQNMREYGLIPLGLVGKTGVELFYESALRGTPGGRQIEVNSRGQEVRLLGTKDPVTGGDIKLTIDARIQDAAVDLLAERPGSVVLMDLASADVLGLVSSPSFDPNVFTDRHQKHRIQNYLGHGFAPLINRAIGGQYPPGSVFKIPVALAAIERKKLTGDSTFDCPGYYMLGRARFGCAHVHGNENLFQAIAHSCNVYFFHAGQMLTAPVIGAFAKAFGLSHPTGIDLPFEAQGKLVLPGSQGVAWYTGNTLNLTIGQGDTLVTPIQLTVLAAAVANDGIVLRPRILRAKEGKVVSPPDLAKRPLIRLQDATWRVVQKGMQMVVSDPDGTGHLLGDLQGMTIWGKTGTAQAGKKGDHAWFVGYVRSPKNNFAFCVFLEHGGASANAVALTRDFLAQLSSFGVL